MTPIPISSDHSQPDRFVPNPAQRRLLDYIHENPSFKTIFEMCDSTGIGRTTYYRWCQDPAFCRWLATAWSSRLIMEGTVLLNVARVQSTRSFHYWKALFELIFDPKGFAVLQQWQQCAGHLDPAAFESDPELPPEDEPGPVPTADPRPAEHGDVPLPSQSNQLLAPENGTNRAPFPGHIPAAATPKPHQVARCFQRALTPRRPHRPSGSRVVAL